MSLVIDDSTLRELQMDERQARIEIACRVVAACKLHLWPAARLAGLSRSEMEAALMERGLAVYRPTVEDLEHDLAVLKRLDELHR